MARDQNVRLLGAEELQHKLEVMLENTADLRQVWDDIYEPAVTKGMARYFATQGDNRWPDLTDRYLFYKAKKGAGSQTLVGTPSRKSFPRVKGTLRDSLTKKGHPAHIYDLNPRWMRVGTRDPLANIHFAKKGRRKRKPMDARSPSMQLAFKQAVEEHMKAYERMWAA